ncbi:hypothetical protein ES707_16509 [subsurface metagenome]
MKQYEKMCWSVVIFVLIFAFLMIAVFEIKAAELDGGGRLGFGYLQELDAAIVDFDVAFYIAPEERFRGSIFVGMEFLVESPDIVYSKLPYLVQCTIGGTLNYDILYVLAQDYHALVENSDSGHRIKLAVGMNYNMPYQAFNPPRHNPLFSSGIDLSLGCLPISGSYFANIDVALYVRPDKLINGVIFGGVEVLSERAGKYGGSASSYCPYQDRYSFGVALSVTMFSLRIEHYCIHPVFSRRSQFEAKACTENSTKYSIGIQYHYPFRVKRI